MARLYLRVSYLGCMIVSFGVEGVSDGGWLQANDVKTEVEDAAG